MQINTTINNDSLPFLSDYANKQVKLDFPFTIFRSEHGRYSNFRQKMLKEGSNLFITSSESIDVQTKLTYIQKVLIVNYDSCT